MCRVVCSMWRAISSFGECVGVCLMWRVISSFGEYVCAEWYAQCGGQFLALVSMCRCAQRGMLNVEGNF